MSDILNLANAAAATAVNMTEAKASGGGGEYVLPPAGTARARLVGYVEIGVHETSAGAGKPKVQREQVELIFELSGPKYEPTVLEDGGKIPHRVTLTVNAAKNYGGLSEKSNLYKTFKRMNFDGAATHMSQLLGKPFLLVIGHEEGTGRDGQKRTFLRLKDDAGVLNVKPTRYEDPIDQSIKEVPVDPPISALRLFVWNAAPEFIGKMWDSLFIDGEYPERKNEKGEVTAPAKSKNVFQNKIKDSLKFIGSPAHQHVQTNGADLKLGAQATPGAATAAADVTPTETKAAPPAASDDPLANI